ncbi:unnamed protein product [Linum trigynum]|uniref:GDSL esterase/lipase At5g03980-like n=1 Tax=Linum trigynum TaxID=586398 RepID=A0AAV2G9X9_9ROSI
MAAAAAFQFITLLSHCSVFPLLLLVTPCLSSSSGNNNSNKILKRCGFDAIYQLGDSFSDTGNLIQQHPESWFGRLPYGESFLIKKRPTGRCSDGLLIVDYLAISAGIPLLDPYLDPNSNMGRGRGVNFAVAGSTALPLDVLSEKGISPLLTNTTLSDQLDWMFTHFNSICYSEQDCGEKLKSALFMVGEIGESDYIYGLYQGRKIEEVMEMVPDVVEAVKNAVTRVITYGARRIVVPGNFPFGCLPIYLAKFKTNTTLAYDEFSCLKKLNSLSILHNEHLKQAIQLMKKDNPNVTIIYGDYYKAYQWILNHSTSLGFNARSLQKACCGAGGDYGFNSKRMCGAARVPICPDPNRHISWDGLHLTQMAYRRIASKFIADIFPLLHCP